ncbi:hypothetical protein KC19_1G252500 [Ceratodon purpureus]|uniref:Protein kinase domain-containing protein n=1 Tax=Ceratodon purpureus TaxID=3225 RepID=A0A8T0J970_CERPU|nr:hypothetical protein KC19_1G252500 [Ceratodon purpureus]
MKPRIWLSFDGRPWQELADDDNGTIAVSRIAARTRLRPDSLTVGDDSLGIFEGITIQDIRSVLGPTAGTARECAVPVDGDALQPGPADSKDRSGELIKPMLLPQLQHLPRNEFDLARILFPEPPGKLAVSRNIYRWLLLSEADVAEKYLLGADDSVVTGHLTASLTRRFRDARSEMHVSMFVGNIFHDIFWLMEVYSGLQFQYELLFNCNEVTGDSLSGSTRERSRPDTLITASGCTFLVGEDKLSSLTAALEDLRTKIRPLSSMFYGDLACILGYVAAGTNFQWVCIDKSGDIKKAGNCLSLSSTVGRSQFLLSVGYAYQLIMKMALSVPFVLGRRAMFTRENQGDREIAFYPGFVRKSIKNFQRFCDAWGTNIDLILRAYELGETCRFLPRICLIGDTAIHHNSYRVDIRPIGYSPVLGTEQDTRMLAQNVCEALSVLHEAGLVHRDIRLQNILQVSKEQFMLIDLETVAASPFRVPPGFKWFKEWSDATLEGAVYTPLSDMYQLGILLERRMRWESPGAKDFIRRLKTKQCSAAMALDDPWISNPTS